MLGDRVGALKFNFGSGYRIYFGEFEEEIILLLCASDKSSQKKRYQIDQKLSKRLFAR